ncbi:2-oxoglutarate dehydrogenase [Candidatus Izemoplasma sp. B36]|uniref:2-oxoglutarate dehydrogenase n=1 Tax=Candidatus Izemoplasma sp. B36 TaxID=3242468 RepID=UPI003557966B
MFGFRSDGKRIKKIDPFMKIVPHIMFERTDAMVNQFQDYDCEGIDNYIKEKRKAEGIRFTYLDILVAAVVRLLSERPKLNRFVVNGRIYKRNNIQVSFAIKKKLVDSAEETTVKMTFDGTESIYDVKEKLDAVIKENKGVDKKNKTDKIADAIVGRMPNFMIKILVGFLKWMDKHGILPKSIIDGSPMHTSVFLVHLKSIKMPPVLHHIYNFGTTGAFMSIGQEKYEPVVKDRESKEIVVKKIMRAGVVIDERISDGLYNSLSLRYFKKLMEDPTLLDKRNEDVKKDLD